jgi:predicted dehydrogenase
MTRRTGPSSATLPPARSSVTTVTFRETRAIGVGIIGLSASRGWAATAHLPALRSLPDYEVRAVSGSTPGSAKKAAAAHGVAAACADHVELANRDDVDLVVVTVKVPEHHRLVSAAIEAGKAVLCEWPLGNGAEEAADLAGRAAARGVRGFVGLQAWSAPAVRFIRDLVHGGAVGEVLSASVLGAGDRWGPTIHPSVTYLLDKKNGATLLTIPFGHTLEAVSSVLGEFASLNATMARRRPASRRTDTGETVPMTAEDQIAVSGVLAGGAVVSMHYRGGRSAGTEGDLVVSGSSGHLQYGQVEILAAGEPGGALVPARIPDRYYRAPGDRASLAYTVAEAYVQIAADLRHGTGDAPDFADALRRHRTLEAIERAAQTGQRQSPSPTPA